jgi:crotonobetainyl-CoA:carnitine CoA-transferase CaiB-like acyl-CoA transferase
MSDTLRGLKVLDLGVGMASALVTKFLVEQGAEVDRLEPEVGDPFYTIYPAYEIWHRGKGIRALRQPGRDELAELITGADICVLGGEDYPGLDWPRTSAELPAAHARLITLELQGYPTGTNLAGRPAVDLLVQARTGLVWEESDEYPVVCAFPPPTYGAALQGLVALLAAVCEREYSGVGQGVATSLFEGALTWCTPLRIEASRPGPRLFLSPPKPHYPTTFQCGDGQYVHLVIGSRGSKGQLYKILGIDDPAVSASESGFPVSGGHPKLFYGDVDRLARYVSQWHSGDLLQALWAAGIAAETVLPPGGCWDDPQTQHNGVIVRNRGDRHVGRPVQVQCEAPSAVSKAPTLQAQVPVSGRPLSNLRVVDFGTVVAGPVSSVSLGDLGADVIKVETLEGDPLRGAFRPFSSANRGKRSICIDLKAPDGRAIAHRL